MAGPSPDSQEARKPGSEKVRRPRREEARKSQEARGPRNQEARKPGGQEANRSGRQTCQEAWKPCARMSGGQEASKEVGRPGAHEARTPQNGTEDQRRPGHKRPLEMRIKENLRYSKNN